LQLLQLLGEAHLQRLRRPLLLAQPLLLPLQFVQPL
jgi:hypothetical protein